MPLATDLRSVVQERFIRISFLSWRLRLPVAFVVAASVAAAVLIALRDVSQPHVSVFLGTGLPLAHMPTTTFAASLLFWVVGWALLLTGALYSHWSVKLLVLACFLYPISQTFVMNPFVIVYELPIAAIYFWAGVVWWMQRHAGQSDHERVGTSRRRLPVATFFIILVCLVLHYGVLFWLATATSVGTENDFVLIVSDEVQALSYLLLPVLFLSGTDFTEWLELVGGQAASLLRWRGIPYLLAGATALASIAILAYRLIQRGTFAPFDIVAVLDVVSMLALGGLFALLLLGIMRLGRVGAWVQTTVPVRGTVIAAIVTMAVLVGPGILSDFILTLNPPPPAVVANYAVYKHTAGSLVFSAAYPSTWQFASSEPKNASDILVVGFLGAGKASSPVVLVVGLPAAAQESTTSQSILDVVQGYCSCAPTINGTGPHGAWGEESVRSVETDSHGKQAQRAGYLWWQMRSGTLWIVYGFADSAGLARYTPVFTAMLDSWRPDGSATAPAVPDSQPALVTILENLDPGGTLSLGLVPLLLALFLGLPWVIRGRRKPGALAGAGLFLVVYGLRSGFLLLPKIIARLGIHATNLKLGTLAGSHVVMTTLPSLNEATLQIDLAVFTLLTLCWLALRRRLVSEMLPLVGLLFTLNAGLQLLVWLDQLIQVTNQLSTRFTILTAVLVVCAFLWDLLTSGDLLTGPEQRTVSRFPRLFLYLGYSMLGFTVVLFIASVSTSNSPFDTGDWTEIGLTALGIPLLLTGFLLRASRWRAVRQPDEHNALAGASQNGEIPALEQAPGI